MNYHDFLEHKTQLGGYYGFEPIELHPALKDFQADLVTWALQKGKSAIFADTGLGKSLMQLCWADNVARETGRPVIILAPLSVSFQTVQEAEKFGIEAYHSRDGIIKGNIIVTNYEKLHMFNDLDFAAAVCDESGILKGFQNVRRNEIIHFMRKMKYRLLCSATPAPNDYVELGNSSECLGELGHLDMLREYFRNKDNDSNIRPDKWRWRKHIWEGQVWRFKGHAEEPFWKWICSWARAIRRPSDLGYSDDEFLLPPLIEKDHLVKANNLADGMLFPLPAIGLSDQREERRRTINERCETVLDLVTQDDNRQSMCWCDLNEEGDRLEEIIRDGVQISGRDKDEAKEDKFKAFIKGDVRILITKPKIGAWGLNMQHCHHVTTFVSNSYESRYQLIRRCYRYGQKYPVEVDTVHTEGDMKVLENLKRKGYAADRMFEQLVRHMNDAIRAEKTEYKAESITLPSWI